MANICTTNYVIEGEKNELDALYETMKNLQGQALGQLVKALGKDPDEVMCRGEWSDLERQGDILRMTFETAWTPCHEVTDLMEEKFPSIRIYYKAVEPGCEVYLKNDAEGKYFPETAVNGDSIQLLTEEQERLQTRIIRGIIEGNIKIKAKK
jgi:hypothetical protein